MSSNTDCTGAGNPLPYEDYLCCFYRSQVVWIPRSYENQTGVILPPRIIRAHGDIVWLEI